ncbi:MAG: hypothetical protein ABJN26_28440 [Stappiaceae bacterium]
MLIETYSHPKSRDFSIPNEDTVLLLPGIAGIFDGATDALGRMIGDLSPGRLASETIANECGRLFADETNLKIPMPDLMQHLSNVLEKKTGKFGYHGRPATTLALVLHSSDVFRFIVNGDSGIRINEKQVLRHSKRIDDVAAAARIALFNLKAEQRENPDQAELETRKVIFLGLSESLANDMISKCDADQVVADTISSCTEFAPPGEIEVFLLKGIQHQYLFANSTDRVLGYSILNGSNPMMRDVIDITMPAREIDTIEVFSDGYFEMGPHAAIDSWEDAFAEVERTDFHKIEAFPNVKGSMSSEFADDRSVITMRRSESDYTD